MRNEGSGKAIKAAIKAARYIECADYVDKTPQIN